MQKIKQSFFLLWVLLCLGLGACSGSPNSQQVPNPPNNNPANNDPANNDPGLGDQPDFPFDGVDQDGDGKDLRVKKRTAKMSLSGEDGAQVLYKEHTFNEKGFLTHYKFYFEGAPIERSYERSFEYDESGKLTRATDLHGFNGDYVFTYNQAGQLERVVNQRDGSNVSRINLPNGYQMEYKNANNNVRANIGYFYNANDHSLTMARGFHKDRDNQLILFSYDFTYGADKSPVGVSFVYRGVLSWRAHLNREALRFSFEGIDYNQVGMLNADLSPNLFTVTAVNGGQEIFRSNFSYSQSNTIVSVDETVHSARVNNEQHNLRRFLTTPNIPAFPGICYLFDSYAFQNENCFSDNLAEAGGSEILDYTTLSLDLLKKQYLLILTKAFNYYFIPSTWKMISKNLILEDNQSSGDVPTRLNYSYDKNYLIQSITMTQNEVQVGIIEYSYEYY